VRGQRICHNLKVIVVLVARFYSYGRRIRGYRGLHDNRCYDLCTQLRRQVRHDCGGYISIARATLPGRSEGSPASRHARGMFDSQLFAVHTSQVRDPNEQ
jgi:hypothetical protein